MKKRVIYYKNKFKNFVQRNIMSDVFVQKFSQGSKRVFLIGTPTHGNLGDQAIAYAETEYIRNNLSDYDLCEITYDEVNVSYKALRKYITHDDLILMHGGGNLGDLYIEEEDIRRLIISKFPENKILVFPQTIDFKSKKELSKSKKIYNKHKNLTICARERKSFEIMQMCFSKNNILLTPDIVLYLLNKVSTNAPATRDSIVTCLRSDVEKKLSSSDVSFIDNMISDFTDKHNIKYVKTDTVVPNVISPTNRVDFLKEKFNQFSMSKIVVTDRLHGMVFASLTKTPCIVFSNNNHKVEGVYEWIKSLNYIRYLKDVSQFSHSFKELIEYDTKKEYLDLHENFKQIVKALEES